MWTGYDPPGLQVAYLSRSPCCDWPYGWWRFRYSGFVEWFRAWPLLSSLFFCFTCTVRSSQRHSTFFSEWLKRTAPVMMKKLVLVLCSSVDMVVKRATTFMTRFAFTGGEINAERACMGVFAEGCLHFWCFYLWLLNSLVVCFNRVQVGLSSPCRHSACPRFLAWSRHFALTVSHAFYHPHFLSWPYLLCSTPLLNVSLARSRGPEDELWVVIFLVLCFVVGEVVSPLFFSCMCAHSLKLNNCLMYECGHVHTIFFTSSFLPLLVSFANWLLIHCFTLAY